MISRRINEVELNYEEAKSTREINKRWLSTFYTQRTNILCLLQLLSNFGCKMSDTNEHIGNAIATKRVIYKCFPFLLLPFRSEKLVDQRVPLREHPCFLMSKKSKLNEVRKHDGNAFKSKLFTLSSFGPLLISLESWNWSGAASPRTGQLPTTSQISFRFADVSPRNIRRARAS